MSSGIFIPILIIVTIIVASVALLMWILTALTKAQMKEIKRAYQRRRTLQKAAKLAKTDLFHL